MINILCLKRLMLPALLAFSSVASWAQVKCNIKGASLNLAGPVYLSTNSLLVAPGGKINVSTATVKIAGTVSNAGIFTAVNGTIVMNGSYAQSIPASTFTDNTIKSLVINNTSGVTLSGPLSLTDVLTVSTGSLSTGGYLTLTSTAAATARVAPITSASATPVNGNVTVERYVPGRRSYRLITSSVTTSTAAVLSAGEVNSSIWGSWQNSGNNVAGNYGTFITGGNSADGFDTQLTNPSLFTYNDVSRQYTGFTSANGKNTKYTPLTAGIAYYMFVYGDRLNTVTTSSPNYTVLRAAGTLKTGDQTYNAGSPIPLSTVTGRYTLLGNPFASPIDWTTISGTDLSSTYWGWDPNLSSTGGYITVNKSGSVILIAPFSGTTGLNQYIQSGQGFFVQTTGPSPTLIIREQDKVATTNAKAFRTGSAPAVNDVPLLAINLLYANAGSTLLADGALAAFNSGFSTGVSKEDATKIESSTEGLSITNSGQLLSIDGRPMPQNNDTLFLNTARLTRPQYTFQIFARQMNDRNVSAYLEDSYLNVSRPLSLIDTNNIAFDISLAESASYSINRFRIVFNPSVVLPVTFTSINAELKNRDILVDWRVAGEAGILKYEVEYAVDGMHFKKIAEVAAKNRYAVESYTWLDVNPPAENNYYRIRTIQADGKTFFSKVIMVKTETARFDIHIYPNPVIHRQITVQIKSAQRERYTLTLYDNMGQQLTKLTVDYSAGVSSKVIYLDKKILSGFYRLQVDSKNVTYRQNIFIE